MKMLVDDRKISTGDELGLEAGASCFKIRACRARLLTRGFMQIVNPKGEMKGSAITGPVGKEAAELWPVCFNLHA